MLTREVSFPLHPLRTIERVPVHARIVLLFLALATLAPLANAHVDLCMQGACAYSWEWNYGGGNCVEGRDHWWSYRTVRASYQQDDVKHTVEVRNNCDAHNWGNTSSASSSLHAEYTTYNSTSRQWTWVWVDWYGTDQTNGSETCTVRYWGYRQTTLPDGTTSTECPERPPPAVIPLP